MVINKVRNGYPGLAEFMGPQFDQGVGFFRQFAEANARNLLYMQAEILCLERELAAEAHMDENGPDSVRQKFARNVFEMRRSGDSRQWAKILEIREKLDAYNNCLLQQTQIAKLDRANKHDLEWLLDWYRHDHGGARFLTGYEARALDPSEVSDLVTISSRSSKDKFTRWIEEHLLQRLPGFIMNKWREPIRGSEHIKDLSRCNLIILGRVVRAVHVVLSASIPSVTVLVLYFIDSLSYRLIAIAGFSGIFSIVLAIFTTARPVEIFTATAAFASVQAVFVGGTTDVGQGGMCQCAS